MLHTYVHGGSCIAIQYDNYVLILNPNPDNYQQSQRLGQYIDAHTIYTIGPMTLDVDNYIWGPFSLILTGGCAYISVAGIHILYHQYTGAISPTLPVSNIDLALIDISVGIPSAYAIAEYICAKTVVPLNVTSEDDPISFCREIMLRRWGVPKYLKNGQYIVHDI